MKKNFETGFSTLEVIAAVAIIGIALVPIAALQTQLARSEARLAETHAQTTSVQNALSLLRQVNPMLSPAGQRTLDDRTTLSWTSAPISDVRPSVNPPGFEVQLYRLSGEIRRRDDAVTAVQLDLVGWRQIAGQERVRSE